MVTNKRAIFDMVSKCAGAGGANCPASHPLETMTILPCEVTTVESAKDATEAKLQRARPQELAVARGPSR